MYTYCPHLPYPRIQILLQTFFFSAQKMLRFFSSMCASHLAITNLLVWKEETFFLAQSTKSLMHCLCAIIFAHFVPILLWMNGFHIFHIIFWWSWFAYCAVGASNTSTYLEKFSVSARDITVQAKQNTVIGVNSIQVIRRCMWKLVRGIKDIFRIFKWGAFRVTPSWPLCKNATTRKFLRTTAETHITLYSYWELSAAFFWLLLSCWRSVIFVFCWYRLHCGSCTNTRKQLNNKF